MPSAKFTRRAAGPEDKPAAASDTTVRARSEETERHEAAPAVDPGVRHEMIATVAYLYAEARGFTAGSELDDWLRAEADIDRRLGEGRGSAGHPKQTP